jgi:preprotein translocase subunit SecF
MSTATTVLSCIALSFAVNQGVRSLGLMIMIGETVVTVAGLAIVPLGWMALWSVRRRRQGKRGELPPSD